MVRFENMNSSSFTTYGYAVNFIVRLRAGDGQGEVSDIYVRPLWCSALTVFEQHELIMTNRSLWFVQQS